jgi:CheY-like chemotaxis protein
MVGGQRRNGKAQAPLEAVRVLVVEDDIDDARFALEAIEDLGMEVEVTPYAERALQLLEGRSFDCVLLDHRLPRMDGTEFVHELRNRDIELPVVVLTGRGSDERADELFEAGVDACLNKDEGDDREVQQTVEDVLDH